MEGQRATGDTLDFIHLVWWMGMGRLQSHPSFAVEGNTSTEYNLANETMYVNGHGKGHQQK